MCQGKDLASRRFVYFTATAINQGAVTNRLSDFLLPDRSLLTSSLIDWLSWQVDEIRFQHLPW